MAYTDRPVREAIHRLNCRLKSNGILPTLTYEQIAQESGVGIATVQRSICRQLGIKIRRCGRWRGYRYEVVDADTLA